MEVVDGCGVAQHVSVDIRTADKSPVRSPQ